jgi:hypothetical protein
MGFRNLHCALYHLPRPWCRLLRLRSVPSPRLRSSTTQHLVVPQPLPTHASSIISLHVDGMRSTSNRNLLPSRSW